jgi:hypothetical protein
MFFEAAELQDLLKSQKPKFIQDRFYRHDYVKGFMLLASQPKSATELVDE